jgi:hypothetical protein
MTQELVPFEPKETLLPGTVNPYAEMYDAVASQGGFLPRLQLFISQSEMVKSEKIQMNHYGLVTGKDQIDDLGREVDVLLIAWRPRALDASDKSNIRASSDMEGDLFKEIQTKSLEVNSGCMYGPEFLVWIPIREKFATVLFGSKSARNEARNVQQYIEKPCTFKSRLIKTPAYSWQAMLVTACSTPFDIPTTDKMVEVVNDFLTPKEIVGAEKVEETAVTARQR